MKKTLILALVALITLSVYAKQIPTAQITNVAIKERSNKVDISFSVFVPKIGSDHKLTLTPVIYHDSLSQSLTPIVIMGNKKVAVDKRSKQPIVKAVKGKAKQSIPYQVAIPYEDWMGEVSLMVNSSVEGCCENEALASLSLVSNKLIHYDIAPVFNIENAEPKLTELQKFDNEAVFLYPAMEYDKRYEIFEQQRERGALTVSFQQGFSSIDPSYKNNRQTLAQINKALDLIESDPNASLKKIVIVGLASPEGSLAKNDILAEKRATSLKYFVGERVKYDPNLFDIINGSEDWDGLKTLVEKSRMPNRWQVLEIIENYSVRAGREVELMKLDRGNPYRYMMAHFFPQLRNAGYVQIYYDTTPDPDAERAKSAIKFIKNKEYDKALPLLLSIKGDKKLENMIGVCYMMAGEYAQATTYFDKAIANDNSDASEAASNLEQIRILQSIR